MESVVAAIVVMLIPIFADLLGRVVRGKKPPPPSYAERIAALASNLATATKGVDTILEELATVAKDRADAVERLETDLAKMQNRETELKQRISDLENTPIAVAEHFAKLVEPGERRSARRDYVLFGAGVVSSTIVGLILQYA